MHFTCKISGPPPAKADCVSASGKTHLWCGRIFIAVLSHILSCHFIVNQNAMGFCKIACFAAQSCPGLEPWYMLESRLRCVNVATQRAKKETAHLDRQHIQIWIRSLLVSTQTPRSRTLRKSSAKFTTEEQFSQWSREIWWMQRILISMGTRRSALS